jgi:hypothetical protein
MVFAIAARLVRDDGLQVARDFIAVVNAHIDALTAWEARRAVIACIEAMRATREPVPSDCDTSAAFQSAHRFWLEAQASRHVALPAPSAPIAIERSIEVHTAPDGSRSYTYLSDEWGNSVYRDAIIQRNKGSR